MKKYISLLLFFALGFFASCNDFLDKSPDSDLDVDINSEEKIADLLTGAYPEASYIPFLEPRTDNVEERVNAVKRIDVLLGRLRSRRPRHPSKLLE